MELLFENGYDINAEPEIDYRKTSGLYYYHYYSPLFLACMANFDKIVELLLNHGANPDLQDKQGNTPLHLVTFYGYANIAKLLLEHGADPNIKNNSDHDCYDLTQSDTMKLLLRMYK